MKREHASRNWKFAMGISGHLEKDGWFFHRMAAAPQARLGKGENSKREMRGTNSPRRLLEC